MQKSEHLCQAWALACSRQVAPNPLLYPVADVREAATRVARRKVIHPTAQDRIDLLNQIPNGLRAMASDDQLELA